MRWAGRLWCTGYRRDGRERVSNPEIGWIGNNSKHSACGCGGLTTNLDEGGDVEGGKVGKSLPRVRAIDYGCVCIQVTVVEPGDSFLGFLILMKLFGVQVQL